MINNIWYDHDQNYGLLIDLTLIFGFLLLFVNMEIMYRFCKFWMNVLMLLGPSDEFNYLMIWVWWFIWIPLGSQRRFSLKFWWFKAQSCRFISSWGFGWHKRLLSYVHLNHGFSSAHCWLMCSTFASYNNFVRKNIFPYNWGT